ncbi:protein-tyrosine phosphatase-like protein [Polychytrium aggregatum]|uniref:protein-tyrosine phosphatase-like protein n=1 Tax=Polychytrium aggregatum TaxID=110093 RepID=UPI0022FF1584|nr:protein-tyrosine phosphatase-like protein [Polychytrium aggregatum]KAI9197218.1 protein-tyrosine phosphatase-like protein [Polychytrium aggregatum]
MSVTHSHHSCQCSVVNHPSCPFNFLITDCPSNDTIDSYRLLFEENSVTDLIRLCSPDAYDPTALSSGLGINVWDNLAFEDGSAPSDKIVADYRELLAQIESRPDRPTGQKPTIAVHCVSGVGRAPVLVACALIDAGLEREDAIEFVRGRRRGSFNKIQLRWLLDAKGFKKKPSQRTSILKRMFGKKT